MTNACLVPLAEPSHPYEHLADTLVTNGWGLFENLLLVELAANLSAEARTIGDYQSAGIGRQKDNHLNRVVRRDKTHWIEGNSSTEEAWLAWTNGLRIYLNRTLTLM
jgi:SM-20-related protein